MQDPFFTEQNPDADHQPLLDRDELLSGHYELASMGKRFTNLIVDRIFLYLLQMIFGGMAFIVADLLGEFGMKYMDMVSIVTGLFLGTFYYALMEIITGKTIGKYITKTRVIHVDSRPASAGQIIGRSFARLIPFNAFSFLFGDPPEGWHDTLSKTRVVLDESVAWMKG
ncbi:MAG: RDD family protein [Bacteroidota bacterium]